LLVADELRESVPVIEELIHLREETGKPMTGNLG
jgi:hypothetical protein